MTTTKGSFAGRYRPARELAARATLKNGNPADHAICWSTDLPGAARVIAPRVYAEAYGLDDRSHRGDFSLGSGQKFGLRITVVVEVAPHGHSILDRGGFSLACAPRSASDSWPRFEGQVRVDQVDAGTSRIIAQGRYIDAPAGAASESEARTAAEQALREIVALITASFDRI